jgi:hypothetical protein
VALFPNACGLLAFVTDMGRHGEKEGHGQAWVDQIESASFLFTMLTDAVTIAAARLEAVMSCSSSSSSSSSRIHVGDGLAEDCLHGIEHLLDLAEFLLTTCGGKLLQSAAWPLLEPAIQLGLATLQMASLNLQLPGAGQDDKLHPAAAAAYKLGGIVSHLDEEWQYVPRAAELLHSQCFRKFATLNMVRKGALWDTRGKVGCA